LTTKACTKCGEVKDLELFHPSKVNKDGRTSHCRDCRNSARREYGRNNKKELNKQRREWYVGNRDYELGKAKHYNLRKYGITLSNYDEMLNKQHGVCRICGEIPSGRFSLSVDHNHETGKVRGLLCGKCNFAIGLMRDNPDLLRKSAQYLEEA